jgi:flagellar basal body-associated protein FliL
MYTYILIAVVMLILGISLYFVMRKSSNSGTSNVQSSSIPPLETVAAFGRYMYR